ncbi:MAG: hypothetical protein U5K69_28245 [Balneolaceae bacterium]|nr:hypothetical protein [Balneolaceae bacterium]
MRSSLFYRRTADGFFRQEPSQSSLALPAAMRAAALSSTTFRAAPFSGKNAPGDAGIVGGSAGKRAGRSG